LIVCGLDLQLVVVSVLQLGVVLQLVMVVGHAHELLLLPREDVAGLLINFVGAHTVISLASRPDSLLVERPVLRPTSLLDLS